MKRFRSFFDLLFLLDIEKRNRNIDFSQYRPQVLKRRIQHRFHLAGCATYWDYILLLNRDPQEYDRLIESLTVKVSEFFRDPKLFDLCGNHRTQYYGRGNPGGPGYRI